MAGHGVWTILYRQKARVAIGRSLCRCEGLQVEAERLGQSLSKDSRPRRD